MKLRRDALERRRRGSRAKIVSSCGGGPYLWGVNSRADFGTWSPFFSVVGFGCNGGVSVILYVGRCVRYLGSSLSHSMRSGLVSP